MKYPEPTPEELNRLEIETKIEHFRTAQQKLKQSITQLNPFPEEPDIDEYTCPYLPEGWKGIITTQYCEGKALGRGCENIKNCPYYINQKKLQEKYPELDWENPHNIPEKEKIKIKFIKKGAIINP